MSRLPYAIAGSCLLLAPPLQAGSFFANADGVTYPVGYAGNGGTLDVKVCLVPSMTDADAGRAERPLRNAMARWNKGQPTTANVRDNFLGSGLVNNIIDFESVALHEFGHCVGLAHPNLGGNVSGDAINSTQSDPGPDGRLTLATGADGVYGTADDPRGDDINAYWFRRDINNPFSMPEIVDSTTYTRDLAALPVGDLFAANAERQVGGALGVPFTEAAMQHDIFTRQLARTPSHDDISAVRLAESGFDGRQGTADDYDLNLVWGGRSGAADCDLTVEFREDAGLAQCRASFTSNGQSNASTLVSGELRFGATDQIEWFFNNAPPCNASDSLVADEWRQISLPCEVGISTRATIRAVFGDDLSPAAYDDTWVLFVYEYTENATGDLTGAYRKLGLDDELESAAGYWMISESDVAIDVTGEYHSQIDRPVFADTAKGFGWNMVGNPFRFSTAWGDTRIVVADGTLLDLSAADPGSNTVGASACTGQAGPTGDCRVARFAYRYDGGVEAYDPLSPLGGSLAPFDAAWAFAVEPEVEVRINMPSSERTTR